MFSSLVLSAALMGLAGGPHCLAMCGAACVGITQASSRAMWGFQIGRLLGYSSLGALAAASMQGLGWLTVQSAAFRPLWSFFHVLLMLLGLWLLWRAEPPAWLGAWTQGIWRRIKPLGQRQAARVSFAAPWVLGLVWALLPCGLLYSALMLAALSDGAWQGAQVMAAFAVGGGRGAGARAMGFAALAAQPTGLGPVGRVGCAAGGFEFDPQLRRCTVAGLGAQPSTLVRGVLSALA